MATLFLPHAWACVDRVILLGFGSFLTGVLRCFRRVSVC